MEIDNNLYQTFLKRNGNFLRLTSEMNEQKKRICENVQYFINVKITDYKKSIGLYFITENKYKITNSSKNEIFCSFTEINCKKTK